MDQGTPLDRLESGGVANKADDALMKQILAEMNSAGAAVHSAPEERQSEPVYPERMQPQPLYAPAPRSVQFEEDLPSKRYVTPRKNFASVLLDWLRDPLFIGLFVFLISLPALHTYGATAFPIFYAVGGSLSWLGLAVKSLIVAGAFIAFRTITYFLGI
jgi:hypothetical protein